MRSLRNRKIVGWLPLLLTLVGVGVLGAIRDNRFGGDVVWARNYEDGLKQARQTQRPLLFSFHTPGCGWCEKMDAEVFTDPRIVELTHSYVCVRLDTDLDPAVIKQFEVVDFPATILADSQGRIVKRLSGYVTSERLAPALRTVQNASAAP